mmetsp:Transcript_28815/g.56459  ORF Transcript_28815/g.56459 Transcript_28815/m.56459 type:complete len:224 (+) Transcript_28815:1670-2341(+)
MLVVVLFSDPHLLEGRQRGQDRPSNPYRVLSLGRSHHLNLDRRRSHRGQFLCHSLSDALKHGGASREHNVCEEVLSDIDIAVVDGLVDALMDSERLLALVLRLEEKLWAPKSLRSDCDDGTVRELEGLIAFVGAVGPGLLCLEILRNVADLLLHVSDNLKLCRGHERVPSLGQKLGKVLSQVATCQVQSVHGVREGIPLEHGHSVRNAISRVHHHTCGTTGRV